MFIWCLIVSHYSVLLKTYYSIGDFQSWDKSGHKSRPDAINDKASSRDSAKATLANYDVSGSEDYVVAVYNFNAGKTITVSFDINMKAGLAKWAIALIVILVGGCGTCVFCTIFCWIR